MVQDVDVRTKMVMDRVAFEANPAKFCEACEAEQEALRR
jgi:Mg-chelatase subunit ChlI